MRRLLAVSYWLLAISFATFAQSNLTYELKVGTTGENTLLAEFPESYAGEKVNIGIQTAALTEYRTQTELPDFVFADKPQLLVEKFQGIRPAVGYPSLPDTSLNFVLDDLLDMKQIGIRLTESGAMKPHASVSGLMFSHPQARYFNLGKIGEDQLRDYARRRGLPIEICRKFLAGNL